jgi:predicted transcriptional regulator
MICHDKTSTMAGTRQKFATQVDPDILASVRKIAEQEGRQLQALVDEAIADLIEKRKHGKPRQHVMASYLASHEKYGELYNKLAK